ncbi:hypothetical protein F5Y18DRAFT_96389 [Xylariaceae sp. FL1019]|nr:hypothetical protein F5Y18DRAFT_96389 [Xylariaceae sp. FL1019]
MDSNGSHTKDKTSASDPKSKDSTPATTHTPTDTNKSPRKRRKVNHACVYCRRSVSHYPSKLAVQHDHPFPRLLAPRLRVSASARSNAVLPCLVMAIMAAGIPAGIAETRCAPSSP